MTEKIAVLGAARKSIYKEIPGLDVYDIDRDLRTFDRSLPVIAHPPCRGWSAFMSHFSNADEAEKDLAWQCIRHVRYCGGVLEHPAHSKFVKKVMNQTDFFKVVEVKQRWFGYPIDKRTWLLMPSWYVVPEIPFRLESRPIPGEQKKIFENMSHFQRHETTRQFADWLIELVKTNVKLQWS